MVQFKTEIGKCGGMEFGNVDENPFSYKEYQMTWNPKAGSEQTSENTMKLGIQNPKPGVLLTNKRKKQTKTNS